MSVPLVVSNPNWSELQTKGNLGIYCFPSTNSNQFSTNSNQSVFESSSCVQVSSVFTSWHQSLILKNGLSSRTQTGLFDTSCSWSLALLWFMDVGQLDKSTADFFPNLWQWSNATSIRVIRVTPAETLKEIQLGCWFLRLFHMETEIESLELCWLPWT